ncbi:MAG: hypothetical protein AABY26_05850, partial [Nanoarchaeota archaeon]
MTRHRLNLDDEFSYPVYRTFRGSPRSEMHYLISGEDKSGNAVDVPRVPISIAQAIGRQQINFPEEVTLFWREVGFHTGDGVIYGQDGDVLIVLDAPPLRELTSKSELYHGALVLPDESWEELKMQKEKVLHLTKQEVSETEGRGYIKSSSGWIPANSKVEKVWDFLSRGNDNLKYHPELVSAQCDGAEKVMMFYFDRGRCVWTPTVLRPWIMGKMNNRMTLRPGEFNHESALMVGVALELALPRVIEYVKKARGEVTFSLEE